MARTVPATLAEPLTAEESSAMDADREAEHSQPEPEPEAEPAPEAAPAKQPELALEEHDDGPAIDPKTGQERKVNYGALREERTKRRATEGELAKAREQLASFNGRWETLQQLAQRSQQQPQQPAQDEIPDINLDPVGHFQAKSAIAEQKIAQFERWQQTQEGNATAMNNVQQLQRIAQSHEAEFSKNTPDYQDAFEYVRTQRDQELEGMGYADPAQRQQIIQNDALQIAAQALQSNKNAAEVVYKIAKARGFAGKAPAPAQIPAAQQPDALKIAKVAKGQEAGQSIGQVNGSAPADTSIESVLKMSDKDFAKWATEDNFRKLAGG